MPMLGFIIFLILFTDLNLVTIKYIQCLTAVLSSFLLLLMMISAFKRSFLTCLTCDVAGLLLRILRENSSPTTILLSQMGCLYGGASELVVTLVLDSLTFAQVSIVKDCGNDKNREFQPNSLG